MANKIKNFENHKKILKKLTQVKVIYPSEWRIKKKGKSYFYKDKTHRIPIKSKFIFSKGLIENLGLAIRFAIDLGLKK